MTRINNRSTKIAASMLAAALAGSMCIPAAAFADPQQELIPVGDPIAATSVKAGNYSVTISANNRFFKPTEGVLSINKKSATVSFNHTTYDFAWLGTIEEYEAAAKAGDVTADPRYIRGVETTSLTTAGWLKSGSRFTLPITNLNEPFSIAVHNPVKKEMFERKICVNCADKSALVAAANVNVSVRKAGELASDTYATLSPMAQRQVVATDTNNDGKVSCSEVLAAAGAKYMLDEKALAKYSVIKGGKLVEKTAPVKDGDSIVAFTYATKKGKDSYTTFNKSTAKAKVGKALNLTLKGIEVKKANGKNKLTTVKGTKEITVTCSERFGVDGAAAVQIDHKKLTKKGTVSLKFKTAGTYVVTAEGKTAKGSKIIAPVCLVTVTK
ncbi:MAG: hypothetical protein KIG15_00890 [Coriobacteriales bacterium]|nr:hypothetical protein [Coriobacteriales bacterium]